MKSIVRPKSPLMLAVDIYHQARSQGASIKEGIALMVLVWDWVGHDTRRWFGTAL